MEGETSPPPQVETRAQSWTSIAFGEKAETQGTAVQDEASVQEGVGYGGAKFDEWPKCGGGADGRSRGSVGLKTRCAQARHAPM